MTTYSRDTVNKPVKPVNIPQSDWDVMPEWDKAKADVIMIQGNTQLTNVEPDVNVINPPEIQTIPVVPQAKDE